MRLLETLIAIAEKIEHHCTGPNRGDRVSNVFPVDIRRGRNQFARKKTDPRKRLVVYEFSRISNEVQLEIDEAIKNILRKLPE